MYLPQPILPLLAQTFGVSASTASLTISALVSSLAVASLLVGPLSDRVGRRPLLVGCTLLLALPSLACAFAPTLGVLLGLRLFQGALVPGVTAVGIAFLAEEAPPERVGTLLGGYIAATVTGGLLSRVLSGAVSEAYGWRWAFVGSALLSLLVGLWLALRLPASRHFVPSQHLRTAYAGMRDHLRDQALLSGYVIGFCLFFSFIGVFTYLPFYLAAPPFSFSPLVIGLVYVVYGAGIISSPLSGRLSKWLGRRRLLVFSLLLVIIANLATLAPSSPLLLTALLLLCFGNFAAQSAATTFVAAHAAHDRGSANALYLFAYYSGGSLGAFLPGLLWPRFGWLGVLLLTVGTLFIGVLAAARLPRA